MKKHLIITGASKGIGFATAELFLKHGWVVLNLSRTPCKLNNVKNITVDLADINWSDTHAAMITAELKNAEQICLVHNAAVYHKDNTAELNPQTLRDVLEVNCIAPVALNRLLLPLMRPKSSIIYLGSTLSEKAVTNAASYVISKHAIAGLMKSTCQDLARTDIHTSCICPGFTDTEMLRSHLNNDEEIIKSIQGNVCGGRFATPNEIAETIYFAAGNPVINGAMLHANLGQIQS